MQQQIILILAFSLFSSLTHAQQKVWLRSGGPESLRHITRVTNSTPVRLTAAKHGFAPGDVIWVSFVSGNTAANGARRVAAVEGDTFSINGLDGKPVAGNGEAVELSPVRFPGIFGYAGKMTEHALTPSPSVLLDGPAGELTRRVKDPDGTGPQKAPKANPSWVPYDGMQRLLAGYLAAPMSQPILNRDGVRQGLVQVTAALDWYMDNSKTKSLQAVKDWLNSFDRYMGGLNTFTACIENMYACGRGSYTDWYSFQAAHMAYAYALVREQMSEEERRTFANRIFNDLDSGCENMARASAGTVSVEPRSKTVRGNGTRFLADYAPIEGVARRAIHFEMGRAGLWGEVASIQSDTELTLAAALGSGAVTDVRHYTVTPWTNKSCGVNWFVTHHPYAPNVIAERFPATIVNRVAPEDTHLTVNQAGSFPRQVPFFIRVNNEIARVKAVNGNTFTVDRALFATAAGTHNPNAPVKLFEYPSSGGVEMTSRVGMVPLDDPLHNLNFAKVYGYFVVALALAQDDARARDLLQKSWNYFYDFTYPLSKSSWTGISQGGFSYGPGRWSNWMFLMAIHSRASLQPAIEIADGQWLRDMVVNPIFLTLPVSATRQMRYADAGTEEQLLARYVRWVLTAQTVLKGTSEAAFANFWFRNMAKFYEVPWFTGASGQDLIPFGVLYTSEDDASTDYREVVPPHKFFTQTDINPWWHSNYPYNTVVSRQDWTADSTYLWVGAFSNPNDHLGSHPGPGSYKLVKGEYLIAEEGPGTLGTSNISASNAVQFGATVYRQPPREVYASLLVDKKRGTKDFSYFRVDSKKWFVSQLGIQRNYRHFVHLKSGAQDHVLVYDDVAATTKEVRTARVHYYADKSETPNFRVEGDRAVFERQAAQVATAILLPEGEATRKTKEAKLSATEVSRSLVLEGGSAPEVEFLVVHRASKTAGEWSAKLLDAGAGYRAIHIADNPARLVFVPRNGDSPKGEVSATIPAEQSLELFAAGLQPGAYQILADGKPVVDRELVRSDGSLYAKVRGRSFTIKRTGALQALEFTQDPPPLALAGRAYQYQAGAAGGEEPYAWSLAGGALPPGLELTADGIISGIPTNSGSYSFVLRLTDATGTVSAEQTYEILVTSSSEPLKITRTRLPTGLLATPYEHLLTASGGSPPYRWQALGSLPDGLDLGSGGVLSGTPSVSGQFEFEVRVEDSGTPALSQTAGISLEILREAPTLRILSYSLVEGKVGEPYAFLLESEGGIGTLKWSVSGGALPPGLELDEIQGAIVGKPEQEGVFTFSLRLEDERVPAAQATASFQLTVLP